MASLYAMAILDDTDRSLLGQPGHQGDQDENGSEHRFRSPPIIVDMVIPG